MADGREAVHVGADLGHDHPGRERADAGDRGQQLDRGAKGGEPFLDLPVDPPDRRVQGVDLVQVQPQQEAVVRRHPAPQRLPEPLRRRREPGAGERRPPRLLGGLMSRQ